MLPGKTMVVDENLSVCSTPVDLGAHDNVVAVPSQFFNGLAHDNLGAATCIAVGYSLIFFFKKKRLKNKNKKKEMRGLCSLFSSVEEVDAAIIGLFHACNRFL